MRGLVVLVLLIGTVLAAEKFEVSFGTGSSEKFSIVENSCYVYTLKFPKDEKLLAGLFNRALISSIVQVKKDYRKRANGFYNVRFLWQIVGKELIVVQVCGDVVKRRE